MPKDSLRPRVYLSGPITNGDPELNFNQSIDAMKALMARGFAVLNPMLTMKVPEHCKITHEEWIANDLAWVFVTEAVLRLPGYSPFHGGDSSASSARRATSA